MVVFLQNTIKRKADPFHPTLEQNFYLASRLFIFIYFYIFIYLTFVIPGENNRKLTMKPVLIESGNIYFFCF
jgi:hypothetical protein